jgi:hypothetical protein
MLFFVIFVVENKKLKLLKRPLVDTCWPSPPVNSQFTPNLRSHPSQIALPKIRGAVT